MTLQPHQFADLFPMMEGTEFAALRDDIKANGLHDRIVLFEGKILDGRNRYRACIESGVVPEMIEFETELAGDPLQWVISKNLKRRHLNESQRAMVAARLANMQQGARTDLAQIKATSQSDAAVMLNVGRSAVQQAKQVQEMATPELQSAVEQGHIAVSVAAKAASLPAGDQRVIAEKAKAGETGAARSHVKKQMRAEKEKKLAVEQISLPTKKYGVIYADPPWRFQPYSAVTGMDRAADNHYPTMDLPAIMALDVPSADDAVLFLWATVPMLVEALDVMKAWGFTYKSNFVWVKDRLGTGYWARNRHELLLIGVKGKIPAPAPGEQFGSVIEAPLAAHSAKPFKAREMIEEMFPTLPRLEMFARERFEGWDCWGNEASGENQQREEANDAARCA